MALSNSNPLNQKLKKHAASLPLSPGVYRMLDRNDVLIYVGKAKQLRHRVLSYFSESARSVKTRVLMSHVHKIEVILTENECEALLLEANLIKQYRPRYNVVLRDDKSYPYLSLSIRHDFPRLDLHRGALKKGPRYYGPYPSVSSVRTSLNLMQKLFRVRQCADADFSSRTRPCLQYQIDRCTAPCVGYVSKEAYQSQIDLLRLFLQGQNEAVIEKLSLKMQSHAIERDYEQAARLRDCITDLRQLQSDQRITQDKGNVDVIGLLVEKGLAVVSVLFVRGGRVLGQKHFFPHYQAHCSEEETLRAFVMQYYLNPKHQQDQLQRIVIAQPLTELPVLQTALQQLLQRPVQLVNRIDRRLRPWAEMVQRNCAHALSQRANDRADYGARWSQLTAALSLKETSFYVACFDISHIQGHATVGSCVTFDQDGPRTEGYRRFTVKGVTPGDDYAAMRQVVTRYLSRLQKDQGIMPAVLLIDGGKGQLSQAQAVVDGLDIVNVLVVGVAKGEGRKAGKETLHFADARPPLHLEEDHLGFHLIQRIRDEAHRFAITAHRQKRSKLTIRSKLETIPGVGARRRKALLLHFGGFQGVLSATVASIAKVEGISPALAKKIYHYLHKDA